MEASAGVASASVAAAEVRVTPAAGVTLRAGR